jgi:hypothetical protein
MSRARIVCSFFRLRKKKNDPQVFFGKVKEILQVHKYYEKLSVACFAS